MTEIEQLQARIKELESECARCQMLEMEISRLKWLIVNMMEPTENIKEFDCEQIQ